MNRKFLVLPSLLLLAVGPVPLAAQTETAPAEKAGASHPGEFPDVVASVNGHTITKAELLTQAALMRSQLRNTEGVAPKPDLSFYRTVLDGLVGELLLFDDGTRRGIAATEEDVDRSVEGLRSQHDSAEAFQASLLEQGTTLIQLREQLHRSLSLEKIMREEIGAEAFVTDEEAKLFYDQNQRLMTQPEQVRVRHILIRAIKNDPDSVRNARAVLGDLRRQVLRGKDFGELAKQHSEDVATRESGGVLPWVPIRDSEADQRLAALEVGQVSEIEETHHGLHLIQVLEKKPVSVAPFEDVKARIIYMLETSRLRLGVQDRVQALRESAKIEIFI